MEASLARITVKFCGHCSPRKDMMKFMQQLKKNAPEYKFCFYLQNPDADILLLLNACHAECCTQPDFAGPVVIVSPERVDGWATEESRLCETVLQVLGEKFSACQ